MRTIKLRPDLLQNRTKSEIYKGKLSADQHCNQRIAEIKEEGIWRVALEISSKKKPFEWQKVQSVNTDISYIEKEKKVKINFSLFNCLVLGKFRRVYRRICNWPCSLSLRNVRDKNQHASNILHLGSVQTW